MNLTYDGKACGWVCLARDRFSREYRVRLLRADGRDSNRQTHFIFWLAMAFFYGMCFFAVIDARGQVGWNTWNVTATDEQDDPMATLVWDAGAQQFTVSDDWNGGDALPFATQTDAENALRAFVEADGGGTTIAPMTFIIGGVTANGNAFEVSGLNTGHIQVVGQTTVWGTNSLASSMLTAAGGISEVQLGVLGNLLGMPAQTYTLQGLGFNSDLPATYTQFGPDSNAEDAATNIWEHWHVHSIVDAVLGVGLFIWILWPLVQRITGGKGLFDGFFSR